MSLRTPGTIKGSRLVTNINSADIVRDVSPVVLMLQDDRKNLMTYLQGLKQETTQNSQFEWLTDEIVPNSGNVGAALAAPSATAAYAATANLASAGDTTATIKVNIDDIIRIPATGEVMRVTAVPTDMSAVAVQRNLTGGATAALTTAMSWRKVGDARAANSRLYSGDNLQSLSTKNTTAYNYTQTFREAVGHGRRELGTKLYSGGAGETEKAKALMVHCQKIENAIILGERLDEGNERTHTGGLEYFVRQNGVTSAAVGSLTQAVFDEFNRVVTEYGNRSKRVLFCSRKIAGLISSWAYANQRVQKLGGGIKYGVNVESIRTAHGTDVDIITSDVLQGVGGTATGTLDGHGFLLDMAGKGLKTFNGDYMKFAENVQLPDQDGKADAFLSDVGFIPGDTRKDGILTGVTSA